MAGWSMSGQGRGVRWWASSSASAVLWADRWRAGVRFCRGGVRGDQSETAGAARTAATRSVRPDGGDLAAICLDAAHVTGRIRPRPRVFRVVLLLSARADACGIARKVVRQESDSELPERRSGRPCAALEANGHTDSPTR